MKILGVVLGVILLLFGISFVATGMDLTIYKFWAPKRANAERVVFENTTSFVQGKKEYIGRLRYQYQQATGPQKDALRTLILSEADTVDIEKLPPDLQAFVSQLRGAL